MPKNLTPKTKDKKRILVTLWCKGCYKNLEFESHICVDPSNGSAYHPSCYKLRKEELFKELS